MTVMLCPQNVVHLPLRTIVEVRITCDGSDTTVTVHDCFQRVDKDTANSSMVIHEILSFDCGNMQYGENERRAILIWCNTLRSRIIEDVSHIDSNKSIVLDVGTGTGQSLDSFIALEHTSFVLVEPDEQRCKTIVKRLGIKRYETSPDQLIIKVRALKSRSIRFCVINCTLNDLWNCINLRTTLFPEFRAIICMFSIHYLLEDLQNITEEVNVPIYGCIYTYDKAADDGTLIDFCGILMKRTSDDTCEVKWGRDKKYSEPHTLRSDYSFIGIVQQTTMLIDIPDGSMELVLREICANVVTIVPRKRMG